MTGPSNSPKKRPAPFSIRFTKDEKDLLRDRAGGLSLSRYIREAALGSAAVMKPARPGPVKDGQPLGRLLALLGQSRLASNLNQIAKAAHQGSLPVTAELEDDLRQACGEVADMRRLLMEALGLRTLAAPARKALTQEFQAAAGEAAR